MMKTKLGRKALSHERIIQIAARTVRRSGFHGVRVAEVMNEVGMTHGGFYAHFESRDQLLAEAVTRASAESVSAIQSEIAIRAEHGVDKLQALVEIYLSNAQLVNRDSGCPVAALCSEFPGQSPQIVDSSRLAVSNILHLVQGVMPTSAEHAAWAVTATLIGALQLARTMGDGPKGRSILAAARKSLIDAYCSGSIEAVRRKPAHSKVNLKD